MKTSSKYLDPRGHRLSIENAFFCSVAKIKSNQFKMFQLSAGEKVMLLLGVYNTITDNSTMLSTWKKGPKGKAERQHQRSHYMVSNKNVCRDTFKFVYE